jgi:hypothetical protein
LHRPSVAIVVFLLAETIESLAFNGDDIVTRSMGHRDLPSGSVSGLPTGDGRQARKRYTSWTFPALGPVSPVSAS